MGKIRKLTIHRILHAVLTLHLYTLRASYKLDYFKIISCLTDIVKQNATIEGGELEERIVQYQK